jgi:hypothetical protein
MTDRRRGRSFVRGLLKLLALVAVAGGAGAAIGMGLVALSGDDGLSAPAPSTAPVATAPAPTGIATLATRTTATLATSPPRTTTTTTPRPPASSAPGLRILGAVLRPSGTPSGRRRQRARLVMRVRARNGGPRAVTLDTPILRIGSVRTRPDGAANPRDAPFGTLAAGEAKSVTLRYELSGDATPKVTRDRRARLDVGTRSVALRVKVGGPIPSAP